MSAILHEFKLEEFSKLAASHEVFFYYSGFVSQPIIEATADAIRMRLESKEVRFPSQLGAFIEMAQNIVHYSAESLAENEEGNDEIRYGTLCITCSDGGYRVNCSNPVSMEVFERLDRKLSVLSKMTLDEIKVSYRKALKSDDREENSKGGGIGLLTLAKDSKEPIEYAFTDCPHIPSAKTFHLSVTI
jgi:Family of unknown function (DUF6272)